MKNKILLFTAITIIACSCSEILDVEPTSAISVEEALKDKNGIQNAINRLIQHVAVYRIIRTKSDYCSGSGSRQFSMDWNNDGLFSNK